jgi:hypothetical protein
MMFSFGERGSGAAFMPKGATFRPTANCYFVLCIKDGSWEPTLPIPGMQLAGARGSMRFGSCLKGQLMAAEDLRIIAA